MQRNAKNPKPTKAKGRARRLRRKVSLAVLFPGYTRAEFAKKIEAQRDHHIAELREAYLHRGLVLYLGAGVSQSVGLPSWPELVRLLTVSMMSGKVGSAVTALTGLSDEERYTALVSLHQDIEKGASYDKPILMMARAIKHELGRELPSLIARNLYRPLRSYLRRKYFDPLRTRLTLPHSSLLDSIVALARAEREVRGVQAIVNYNYDDLVDEKLREQSVRCVTVRSGEDRVPPGSLPCYHVHGILPYAVLTAPRTLPKAFGNFVFSEDEYHAEYADPYRWSNMTQMSLLGRHTGLFVGLSMEDPNIRRLIDVTHRQYPDMAHYGILSRRKPAASRRHRGQIILQNLYEEVESSSFEGIGVRAIWADRHEEIPKLLHRICTQDGQPLSPKRSQPSATRGAL